ncbi:Glucose transporter type 1 [Schistosoma japonicum]|nr:Glucose transporter type 1 [Schistosoma japonicum]
MGLVEKYGITGSLVLTVLVTCFGSSFLIGYNLGVLNLPRKNIEAYFNKTVVPKTPGLDSNFFYTHVSTIFVIAGAIGAFSCGWIADGLGRRNGLILNNIIGIIGGVIVGPCVLVEQPVLLFIGRFIIGINCGITIGVASIYLTEVAPRDLRGGIGACHQLAVTIGIAFSYFITFSFLLNTSSLWPLAIALGAILAAISLVLLPFCPESPRFLYMKKNKEADARKAFLKLNKKEDVDIFIGELREEIEVGKNQPTFRFILLFTQPDLRMPLLIGTIMQIGQQFCGINAVITYSSLMLELAGIPDVYLQYCVFAIGVLNVIVTIISLPLLERSGRRTLLLWPTVSLSLSLLLLTIFVNLADSGPENLKTAMGIISIILILIYICSFALGLGPVPALIVSEIFRQGPRAAAYSFTQSVQWLSNLVVLFTYPLIQKAIGGYSFLPFFVIIVICWIFFFLFMPETKNRTFDEVARDLAFGNIVVGKRTTALEDRNLTIFTKQGNTDGPASESLLHSRNDNDKGVYA